MPLHRSPGQQLIQKKNSHLPLDAQDSLPIIIGPTTAKTILAHRPEFLEYYKKAQIPPELIERWAAIQAPSTLVIVFGSWCGDSQRWMPDLIKLSESPNPFIEIHWIGTDRDKTTKQEDWPAHTFPQKTKKVSTFYLFAPVPGGGTKLVGRIVENPPKIGQTMAEALLELLESNR
jgi:hypothetical protein